MLGFESTEDYRRAREVLSDAQYSYDGIVEALGDDEWFTPRAIDMPRYERLLSGPSRLHTLTRLFLFGLSSPASDVEDALQPTTMEAWVKAGLIKTAQAVGNVRSVFRLTPVDDLLVASDNPQLDSIEIPEDFVMPPAVTSMQLAWAAIPSRSRNTLDLGTGSGYLGLIASRFSEQVIATDRNLRAGQLARFNALLNGVDTLDSRVGDLFEPVQNERFDLILSNPPFVITPKRRLMFRDSGIRGDEFCRRLIREMPSHLNDDGYCQLLCNFAEDRDAAWRNELSEWFNGLGCDALVLTLNRQPIDKYAMDWITATESQEVAVVPALFNEWMDYYDREGIAAVRFLLVTMRRRDGAVNWTHIDDDGSKIVDGAGDKILARFKLLDFLANTHDETSLLAENLALNEDVRLIQEHVMTAEGPRVRKNGLETHVGLRQSAQLDANVMRFLVYCDGQRPLREALKKLSQMLGIKDTHVHQIALPVVRHLIERGFLAPKE
jgi:protein-L-isoaspartate O-methyltransferase